jgi:hypothetical protein
MNALTSVTGRTITACGAAWPDDIEIWAAVPRSSIPLLNPVADFQ